MSNWLRPAEPCGTPTDERALRWSELKAAYVRTRTLVGPDDGPLVRAVATLGLLADRIAAVETAINRAAQ